MNTDTLRIVYELLPGFVAAWIFYSLTAHPRRDIFERSVQALIFTGIIKVLVLAVEWLLLRAGRLHVFGHWTETMAYVWSMCIAVVFGCAASWASNQDVIHRWLRHGRFISRLKVTKKNAFPSEWFSAFQRDDRHVVLSLEDGRTLRGWPEEWPNDPQGHFLLMQVAWVNDETGEVIECPQTF